MKKTLLTILIGIFGIIGFASSALAGTSISFTPVTMSVEQGKTFTLTIKVAPQGAKNYTVKTELHYPADLLEVKSFVFTNSWMPIVQPGYDLIDNTNGVLIKTAGYPGGVSSEATFGTVSFIAKKSGNGTIVLDSNSLALDANNQNVLSGSPIMSFNVTAPVVVPVKQETKPAVTPSAESDEPAVTDVASETIEVQDDSQPEQQFSLLAALGNIITLGTDKTWLGILVGLIILLGVGYAGYSIGRRKQV